MAITASATHIFSEASDNLGVTNNLDVTIKTNGSYVELQPHSVLFYSAPSDMKQEMVDQALIDLEDDNSTADTLKNDMAEIAQRYNYSVTVTIDSQYGTDQLPMIATVKGTSMVPTLQDGQDVVILKTKDFRVGDIVVARHPTYGRIVKRVAKIEGDEVYLMSDNREVVVTGNVVTKGLDTWLPIDDVIGVVKEY